MSQRVAVFASGGGSNLQSLLDRLNGAASPWARVALVVSDRPTAGALRRAESAGVPTAVIPAPAGAPDVAERTLDALDSHDIDFIALAGYLRLVPTEVIARYRARITNVHPALLPAFGGKGMYGMRVHEAVIAAGSRVTGVTIHHVDERYDEGRTIAQWPVPVLDDDSPETLAARVLRVEHLLYPLALERLMRFGDAGLTTPPAAAFAWSTTENVEGGIRAALGLSAQD